MSEIKNKISFISNKLKQLTSMKIVLSEDIFKPKNISSRHAEIELQIKRKSQELFNTVKKLDLTYDTIGVMKMLSLTKKGALKKVSENVPGKGNILRSLVSIFLVGIPKETIYFDKRRKFTGYKIDYKDLYPYLSTVTKNNLDSLTTTGIEWKEAVIEFISQGSRLGQKMFVLGYKDNKKVGYYKYEGSDSQSGQSWYYDDNGEKMKVTEKVREINKKNFNIDKQKISAEEIQDSEELKKILISISNTLGFSGYEKITNQQIEKLYDKIQPWLVLDDTLACRLFKITFKYNLKKGYQINKEHYKEYKRFEGATYLKVIPCRIIIEDRVTNKVKKISGYVRVDPDDFNEKILTVLTLGEIYKYYLQHELNKR